MTGGGGGHSIAQQHPKLQNPETEKLATGSSQRRESEWSTAMSTHGNCKDSAKKKGKRGKRKRKTNSSSHSNYKLE